MSSYEQALVLVSIPLSYCIGLLLGKIDMLIKRGGKRETHR